MRAQGSTEEVTGRLGRLRRDLLTRVRPAPAPGAPGGSGRGPDGEKPAESVVDRPQIRKVADLVALALFFYFVQQWFWPAPLGVLVQGTIIGGLTALIGFGIALIYRANRIINFSQGDLGGGPAALAVLLIVGPGFPYFVALPLGIIAAIVLGGIVEWGIIRRFFKAPRLILTVATIFLSQLLAAIGVILPRFFDITTPPQSFPSPFDFSFEISPIIFRGNDIVALIAVPVVIVALGAFFRFTHVGIAVRASAESSDRAALLGVPVKRIETIVWMISAVLAAVAIFMRAGIVGLPIGQILGPSILVRALAACVIGRMERMPTIFVAAVGLGIIEQAIVWHTGRALLIAPIIFVVVIGALLFQRRGIVARADDSSSWQAAKGVRPIPRELVNVPEVKWTMLGLKVLGVLVALGIPLVAVESRVNLAGVILIYSIIGVSLVLLTGWAGQVSLGQMAFVGLGAAAAGAMTSRLHWDLSIALVLAGVLGAVVSLIIGLPALRIRGLFLAVTTLAFANATASYLLNPEFFDWWLPAGRIERTPLFGTISVASETRMYFLCLAGLLMAVAAMRGLRNSRTGRVLIGVRENERAAQAFGVNVTRAKLTAFALSGFFAAFAGGLFVHHQQALGITPFRTEQSLLVFGMVVIGGLGSVPGALIGATYVYGISYFAPELRFFTSGIGGLILLMIIPGGIGGVIYQARDNLLRQVARRRRILVPSLLADSRDASVLTSTDKQFDLTAALRDMGQAPAAATDVTLAVMAPTEGDLAEADLVNQDAFAPPPVPPTKPKRTLTKKLARKSTTPNGAKKATKKSSTKRTTTTRRGGR